MTASPFPRPRTAPAAHPTRRPGAPRALPVLVLGVLLLLPSPAAPAPPRPLVRLAAESRVCLVGERHRSPAGHRMFGDLVSELAAGGRPVAVGLEIPADRQGLLDRAVGDGQIPDGLVPPVIDSPSYRRMLAGLLWLGRQGPVRLWALDAPGGPGADRDAFMARRVLEALDSGADRVVVLVGNLHVLAVPADRLGGRLRAAGIPAGRVLTDASGDEGGAGPGTWLPSSAPRAVAAVQQLWSLLRRPPGGAAGDAVHGLVLWPGGA